MNRLIEWFIDNPIAANLLMVLILVGGYFSIAQLNKEIFPRIDTDNIEINVPYPGAGPQEVEEQIIIRVEEAIADLMGIDTIRSEAREGYAKTTVEVTSGYDTQKLLNDIKTRVDSITTLPNDAERPQVREMLHRSEIMSLALYGNIAPKVLKETAERLRDDLSLLSEISQVDIQGTQADEMAIEVREIDLRRYNLSLQQVANAIRRHSINLPAGTIRSDQGDIQVQTRGQAYQAEDFSSIVITSLTDGTQLTVGDVANVADGFSENNVVAHFNGQPAVFLSLYVTDNPNILKATDSVKQYVDEIKATLPQGVALDISRDWSTLFKGRMNLLLKNAVTGLALVYLVLMLFLRPALSFWVCTGIAIAFMGALWWLPYFGTSVNMISMFALILVLGIVVDDAIIVGESIYSSQQQGRTGNIASYHGTKRVSKPVLFAVTSTMIFFAPMLSLPGAMGDISKPIPIVVILCLLFSLIESLWILPSHLSHLKPERKSRFIFLQRLSTLRHKFSDGLYQFAQHRFTPLLESSLRHNATTTAIFFTAFALSVAFFSSGWMKQSFMPIVPSDFVRLSAELPEGIAFSETEALIKTIEQSALTLKTDSSLLQKNKQQPFINNLQTWASDNKIWSTLALVKAENRDIGVVEVSKRWRELIGDIPNMEDLSISYTINQIGKAIKLQVSMNDHQQEALPAAVQDVRKALAEYPGVYDIQDSFQASRTEIELDLKSHAETLGLQLADIAQQVRQGFYGEEVQRIPRNGEDVRVMVRYPREERESVNFLETMHIRTQQGMEIPIDHVADIHYVGGYTTIKRENRKRTYVVTAEVHKGTNSAANIVSDLIDRNREVWETKYPGFNISISGDMESENEFISSLLRNFILTLLIIYALMAIAFRSYGQPLLILTAVPFGFMGAIIGHIIMGREISMLSVLGFLACSGVVVNDNLVLLDRINQLRTKGMSAWQAVVQAARDRFRPIVLTSVTTFVGLMPMMVEQSTQAQFLIPMAISLAFGVLFATGVTLILVPCLYYVGTRLHHYWNLNINRILPSYSNHNETTNHKST